MKSLVTKPAQTLVSKLGLGRSRDKSKDHHQQQQRQQQRQSSSYPVVPKSSVGGNGGGRSTPSSNNATIPHQQQHAKTPLLSNATSDSTAASEADTVSIEVTPTIIPLSRSGAPQLKKLGSNTQRQQQQQHGGGGGILHQPHAHNNINNSHIQSSNSNNNSSSNGSITTSRVRFAPTSSYNKYSSQSSLTSTSQSSHQVHLMALGGSQSGGGGGASVASASVVSKDSIFDRVLREENERLKTMGMGERDYVDPYCLVKGGAAAGGGKGVSGGNKRDGMRGGRRVEI